MAEWKGTLSRRWSVVCKKEKKKKKRTELVFIPFLLIGVSVSWEPESSLMMGSSLYVHAPSFFEVLTTSRQKVAQLWSVYHHQSGT